MKIVAFVAVNLTRVVITTFLKQLQIVVLVVRKNFVYMNKNDISLAFPGETNASESYSVSYEETLMIITKGQ